MMNREHMDRIRRILACALRCPGYRRKYAGLNLSAKNFTQLPLLTPRELVERPFDFLAIPYSRVNYIFCSSGSTGKPKILMLSKEDFEREVEYCARFSLLEGVGAGDRVAVIFPMRMWGVGHVVMHAHAKLGASVFPIDTSGSISDHELKEFLSEIVNIAKSFANVNMRVITCDCQIYDDYTIENGNIEKIMNIKIKGGGGTSHIPVFEYVSKNYPNARILICFTDGYTEVPEKNPLNNNTKILWVIPKNEGTDRYVKHGEVIWVN